MTKIERCGSTPILLIHGSPGGPAVWRAVEQALAGRCRVIAPTLVGHGRDEPAERLDIADIAARLAPGLPQQSGTVLAGHSFGGVVALRLALSGAVPVARLVLFEPVAFGILPLAGQQAAFDAARPIFEGYAARHRSGDGEAVQTMVDFWFGAGAYAALPGPARQFMQRMTQVNVRDVEASFRERYDRSELARLTLPVTIVHGDRSPQVARLIAQSLAAALPNARALALAGAGHDMLNTHAGAVAELIAGD